MIGQTESWPLPPQHPDLGRDEVQVWKVDLEANPGRLSRFMGLLSTEEKSRAERFHFQRDRRRFIVRHAVLRMILGRTMDQAPIDLEFASGSRGKPVLAGKYGEGGIRFNMSDSQDLALIALTRDREIGVDLEMVRPVCDIENIVKRYFSPLEADVFFAVPPERRLEVFFNGWTRKEAFLKALGDGLARPLDAFDVTLRPGEAARLIQVRDAPLEASRWSLQALVPGRDVIAALAAEGHDWRLACWNWPENLEFSTSVEPGNSESERSSSSGANPEFGWGDPDRGPISVFPGTSPRNQR